MATTHISVGAPPRSRRAVRLEEAQRAIAFGAAAAIVVSIAVSQILLGAGLLGFVVKRPAVRGSHFMAPLVVFTLLTLGSIVTSADPLGGVVQMKKSFLLGIVPLVYATFEIARVRGLVLVWTMLASASAVVALGQAATRWHDAVKLHASLYDYILDGRIHGLQGHWMTFGGVQMIVLLMLLALLLLGDPGRWTVAGWVCATLLWGTVVLGFTRSIFLGGVPAGVAVLLWASRRWWLLAMPVMMGMLLMIPAAAPVRQRVVSALLPHGDVDSNSRRVLMVRTGLRMIAAHPWLGIGPGQVEAQFDAYVPEGTPRPLPKGWYGHLHNTYLQYAAERGLPASLCVVWMLVLAARDMWRTLLARSSGGWVIRGVLAVIAAVAVEGLFEHNLGDSEVLTMLLVTVACGYAVARQSAVTEEACASH